MNRDYLDLLRLFAEYRVRYLVIGGYAVIQYTEPRYTKDLDIWIEASLTNAKRILPALQEFGAPVDNLSAEELAKPGLLYVFGVPPLRVDILNRVKGGTFGEAWKSRVKAEVEGTPIYFVGMKTLKALKRAAGRAQDKADLEKISRASAIHKSTKSKTGQRRS